MYVMGHAEFAITNGTLQQLGKTRFRDRRNSLPEQIEFLKIVINSNDLIDRATQNTPRSRCQHNQDQIRQDLPYERSSGHRLIFIWLEGLAIGTKLRTKQLVSSDRAE